jgi:DnaJ-class molecular chaperone
MKNVPKRGGHTKPGAAARQTPTGYEHEDACPTCKGTGKVAKDQPVTVRDLALARARR